MSKLKWIVPLMLVILVVGRIAISIVQRPNEKQAIVQALNDSIKASKEGHPGGVMDMLSSQLKVNDMDIGGYTVDIRKFISEHHPDMTVDNLDPVVTGGTAQIVSDVDLSMDMIGSTPTLHLKGVIMTFQKEPAMDLLVIPTQRWRLTQVQTPSNSMDFGS